MTRHILWLHEFGELLVRPCARTEGGVRKVTLHKAPLVAMTRKAPPKGAKMSPWRVPKKVLSALRHENRDMPRKQGNCAHAADPWSLIIDVAQIRVAGGGGGCAPPHPPAFWGSPPPGPLKRRSAPLAAAVVRFLTTEPLVRGSCAAWGRTFIQKSDLFLEEATCPGQRRCLGQIFIKT